MCCPGLQLSIFDVSDELDPRQVAVVEVGDRGSDSEALRDHKAFQFWAAAALRAAGVDRTSGLFALPASLASLDDAVDDWDSAWRYGLTVFQGLVLFDDALRPVGNVTHHDPDFFDPTYDETYAYWRTYRNSEASGDHVTRSLRRGDALFTFSDNTALKTSLDGRALLGAADLAANFTGDDRDGDFSYYGGWGPGWYHY